MTGSVAPMQKYPFPIEPHVIDRMDECINVAPATLHFMTSVEVKTQLNQPLNSSEKAVYFTNHTPKVADFLEGTAFAVALSFSDQEKRSNLAKDVPDNFKRIAQFEESTSKKPTIC